MIVLLELGSKRREKVQFLSDLVVRLWQIFLFSTIPIGLEETYFGCTWYCANNERWVTM